MGRAYCRRELSRSVHPFVDLGGRDGGYRGLSPFNLFEIEAQFYANAQVEKGISVRCRGLGVLCCTSSLRFVGSASLSFKRRGYRFNLAVSKRGLRLDEPFISRECLEYSRLHDYLLCRRLLREPSDLSSRFPRHVQAFEV